jgi:hypothetical protein
MDRLMDARGSARSCNRRGARLGAGVALPGEVGTNFANDKPELLEDIQPVNAPCAPDFQGADLPPCVRRVNRINVPHSAAGTSPFIGDYVALAPAVQFVNDGAGWRWAAAADVSSAGFHAAFADNRNQIPPTQGASGLLEWQRYPYYSPPGLGGAASSNRAPRRSPPGGTDS